jgi:hypothetical protein
MATKMKLLNTLISAYTAKAVKAMLRTLLDIARYVIDASINLIITAHGLIIV